MWSCGLNKSCDELVDGRGVSSLADRCMLIGLCSVCVVHEMGSPGEKCTATVCLLY